MDDETGRRVDGGGEANAGQRQRRAALPGHVRSRLAVPAGHSSIWLRSAAGLSPGDLDDPFANFYFGAFGNNWVDHRDEKRYRDVYSFPGASLNEIAGRNFVKSDARMESSAGSIPAGRATRLLCVVGAAGGLRRRRCAQISIV